MDGIPQHDVDAELLVTVCDYLDMTKGAGITNLEDGTLVAAIYDGDDEIRLDYSLTVGPKHRRGGFLSLFRSHIDQDAIFARRIQFILWH